MDSNSEVQIWKHEELTTRGVKILPDHLLWNDKKFFRSVSLQNREAAASLAETYIKQGEACLVVDSSGILTIWKAASGKAAPENSSEPSSPPKLSGPPTRLQEDSEETASGSGEIVLVVDDSPIVRAIIKRTLHHYFNIMVAGSALEALKILNSNPVSLMLLDVMMPDIDGIEFCRTIRKIPRFKKLPVIMLTAKDNVIDKMKGHIAGTNRYLTKPISPYHLLQVVSEFVATNQTRLIE